MEALQHPFILCVLRVFYGSNFLAKLHRNFILFRFALEGTGH
jgi:hypothetical protein